MRRSTTYSIVDCPDGRFAVVAVSVSGTAYRRDGFLTLAEAESCAEGLRAVMALCGRPLVRRDVGAHRAVRRPPFGRRRRSF